MRSALVGFAACVLAASACARTPSAHAEAAPPAPKPAPVRLAVPRASGPVVIDAELEGKKFWEADVGSTRNLKDDKGQGMVPYTEVKARWDDHKLYLLLYAGDLDLEGTVRNHDGAVERDDAFHLELGAPDDVRVVSVSVLGTVADARCRGDAKGRACDPSWQSHAEVAVDRDGTINKIGDNDEEWVVEMALPFASLGVPEPRAGTRLPFSVRRCEVGHGASRPCGSWGTSPPGELALEP